MHTLFQVTLFLSTLGLCRSWFLSFVISFILVLILILQLSFIIDSNIWVTMENFAHVVEDLVSHIRLSEEKGVVLEEEDE